MVDLLGLQSDIKRDADGYADDFRLQYRHYKAVLSVFSLHPAQQHDGILELVHFIAQVNLLKLIGALGTGRSAYRDPVRCHHCQPSQQV